MPKFEVHITRTTTYETEAPDAGTAEEVAVMGDGNEVDDVVVNVAVEQVDDVDPNDWTKPIEISADDLRRV